MYLFKPKGAGTFLQTHGFFLFLKEEYSDTTMFYYLNSFKPTRVDRSPKRVKALKVRKVDGPPRG